MNDSIRMSVLQGESLNKQVHLLHLVQHTVIVCLYLSVVGCLLLKSITSSGQGLSFYLCIPQWDLGS